MSKKTLKDFIKKGLYLVIVSIMTFSPLLGLSKASAAVVDDEDFNGTSTSALLSDPNGFTEGTGSSFVYATENGIAGSDAIGITANNVWTSKDSLSGLVSGETGYSVSAMFLHSGNSGYGGIGFSTSPTNSMANPNLPTLENAAYIAVHGGATDYKVNSNVVFDYNHDIDGDLPGGEWYSITYSLVKVGDNNFYMSTVINQVDSNGDFVSAMSESSNMFSFSEANNGETLYPFFFTSSGHRFGLIDNFIVQDGVTAPEEEPLDFEGGDGSPETPYLIGSCEQLQLMEEDYTAHYELVNDIDCSDTINWGNAYGDGFKPIAYDSDGAFEGSLDGEGYEISDLYISIANDDKVGLFSEITEDATISNVGVVDAQVIGDDGVGILVGVSYGTIEDSYVTGSVTGRNDVGGLVGGHLGWDTIRDSYSEATVTGDENVGGLAGSNYGNIYNSYASGNVSGNEDVGGLVGQTLASDLNEAGVFEQTVISDSYATGDVAALNFDFENASYYDHDDGYYHYFGGLVGRAIGSMIQGSYATGDVTASDKVGGLVGHSQELEYFDYDLEESRYIQTEIEDSYATGDVYGTDEVGGLIGDANGTNVIHSYASGDVFGEVLNLYIESDLEAVELSSNVGGFVGEIDDSTAYIFNPETEAYDRVFESIIQESFATGNVEGNEDVGGFAGEVDSGSVENSYARGNVTAINETPENIGGFVGTVLSLEGGEIEKVYSTGIVNAETPTESIGGLAGYMDNDDSTTDSFWDMNNSGLSDSFGGTGKTVSQMKTQATFTDAVWDFTDIWNIDPELNDGYPILRGIDAEQTGVDGYDEPDEDAEEEPRRRSAGGKKKIVATTNANTSNSIPSTNGNSDSSAGFNRSLQVGSSGLDVKNLQQFLNTSGFKVAETGAGSPGLETETFGPATQSALAKFQAANGIVPAAGYFGPLTQAFIAAYSPMAPSDVPSNAPGAEPMSVPGSRDLEMGMSGGDVGTLQQFLIDAGYSIAAGVTGYFGQQTKDALIKYQTDKGITPASGYFGPATRSTTGL